MVTLDNLMGSAAISLFVIMGQLSSYEEICIHLWRFLLSSKVSSH